MPFKNEEVKKAYHKEYHAKWYQENRERVYKKKKENRDAKAKWFQELKTTLGCKQCGNSHPAVLDCHHRDPSVKEFALAVCLAKNWSRKRILVELDKCDILCANCHRIFHWNEILGSNPK